MVRGKALPTLALLDVVVKDDPEGLVGLVRHERVVAVREHVHRHAHRGIGFHSNRRRLSISSTQISRAPRRMQRGVAHATPPNQSFNFIVIPDTLCFWALHVVPVPHLEHCPCAERFSPANEPATILHSDALSHNDGAESDSARLPLDGSLVNGQANSRSAPPLLSHEHGWLGSSHAHALIGTSPPSSPRRVGLAARTRRRSSRGRCGAR